MSHKIIEITNELDWLNNRVKGIGGSDAACILGLNPYKTNVELWEEKTGKRQAVDISDKPCVKYGKVAEDYLRGLFILDYPQYEVIYNPYYIHVHNNFTFIQGTFDAELKDKTTGEKGIWECKTTEIKKSADWEKWNGKIPQNYYCQILHYFAIDEEYKFAKLKAQLKSYDKFGEVQTTTKHYHILRSDCEKDIEHLINEESQFIHYVSERKEPPLLLPEI